METGFLANREKQSAMIRRIEIIGEAITHADRATRQAIPVELYDFVSRCRW